MDNKTFDVNIDYDAVKAQYEEEQKTFTPRKNTFDEKNYLQARLGPNETSKTLTIRLLPFSPNGGTAFKKVYMHTVKVNKEVAPSGWKTFVCPNHNIKDGEPFGSDGCPFCETSAKAKEMKNESLDEVTRKKYGDIEFLTKVKEMMIVRCIDRDHEKDGVKFWLFNTSRKKDGVFDKIMNLAKIRSEAAAKKGNKYNIFDINNGLDLIVTLTRGEDGKTTIQIIDDGTPSPLSEDVELGNSWIMDEKKWYDVYTVKSYNYMSIIASGGVPVFNKELGKYVDKYEVMGSENVDNTSEEDTTPMKETIDYSKIANTDKIIVDATDSESIAESSSDNDEDDLPF